MRGVCVFVCVSSVCEGVRCVFGDGVYLVMVTLCEGCLRGRYKCVCV